MVTIFFGVITGLISGDYGVSFGISAIIGCILFLIFAMDYKWIQPRFKRLPRDRKLILEILFALVETFFGFVLAFWISGIIFGFTILDVSIWVSILIGLGVFLIIRSIRYATQFYRDLKAKELVEEKLNTLAAQAELKALKAQINPHFLFNTLNTIAALTHSDPHKAEETIEKLAEMFRYALMSSNRGKVSLREELSFTNRYLEIEKARFGDSLQVAQEIEGDVYEILIPPLVLQPLAENAIRHGRGEDGGVDLVIQMTLQDNELVVSIADQGPGIPEDFQLMESKGVGLRNVDERLRKTYGDAYGLEIGSNLPGGARINFRIPLAEEIEKAEGRE
jgi:sensor histidine kinase YesM